MKQSVYLFFLLILFNHSMVNASEKISLMSLNDIKIIFSSSSKTWNQNLVFLDKKSSMKKLQLENNKNYLQQYCEVLVENKLDNQAKYFGRTKYMTPVIFDSDNCNPGELVNIKITSHNQSNLFGFHKANKIKAA